MLLQLSYNLSQRVAISNDISINIDFFVGLKIGPIFVFRLFLQKWASTMLEMLICANFLE